MHNPFAIKHTILIHFSRALFQTTQPPPSICSENPSWKFNPRIKTLPASIVIKLASFHHPHKTPPAMVVQHFIRPLHRNFPTSSSEPHFKLSLLLLLLSAGSNLFCPIKLLKILPRANFPKVQRKICARVCSSYFAFFAPRGPVFQRKRAHFSIYRFKIN